MMTHSDEIEILRTAIKTYGRSSQVDMMLEEMSELTKALLKVRRFPEDKSVRDNVIEEMADVSIMLDQMQIIFGDYSYYRRRKLERLLHRVMQEKDDQQDRDKAIKAAGASCASCNWIDYKSGRCMNIDSGRYTAVVVHNAGCNEYEEKE